MTNQIDERKLAELGELYDKDPHVQIAQAGIQLEAFLGTLLGKTLMERAQNQMDESITEMLALDPDEDRAGFRKARINALIAQQALTWIAGVIDDGRNAVEQMNKQDAFQDN